MSEGVAAGEGCCCVWPRLLSLRRRRLEDRGRRRLGEVVVKEAVATAEEPGALEMLGVELLLFS